MEGSTFPCSFFFLLFSFSFIGFTFFFKSSYRLSSYFLLLQTCLVMHRFDLAAQVYDPSEYNYWHAALYLHVLKQRNREPLQRYSIGKLAETACLIYA